MHLVNSSPSITSQYFEALTRRSCDKTSIIVKITSFALPLILLVTALIDLFVSCLREKPTSTNTEPPRTSAQLPSLVTPPKFSRSERTHLPADALAILDENGYQYFDRRPTKAELALASIAVYPKIVRGAQQYVVAITGNTPDTSNQTFKFYYQNKQCLNDDYTKITNDEKALSPSFVNLIYHFCMKKTVEYRTEPLGDLPIATAVNYLLAAKKMDVSDLDMQMIELHGKWEGNEIWNRENEIYADQQ